MKKQLIAAVLSSAMILSMGTGVVMVHADSEYSIGVLQMNELDLLDDLTLGFEDAIMDGLGSENILFDEMSAAGSADNFTSILNDFVSEQDNLIFVSSDEMLSAAADTTADIPVIAAGIYNLSAISGKNIAGISSLAPYGEQTDLISAILPDAKTVGILYTESDPFSAEQMQGMTDALSLVGFTVTAYPVSENLESILSEASDACDVLYLPVDAALTANADLISSVTMEKQKPVITGDEATCSLCGLAVSSTTSYDLGYDAGQLAVKVLKGEDVSSIGIKNPTIRLRKYNEATAAALGIAVPDDFESIEIVSIENENDGIEEMTDEEIAEMEAEMEG